MDALQNNVKMIDCSVNWSRFHEQRENTRTGKWPPKTHQQQKDCYPKGHRRRRNYRVWDLKLTTRSPIKARHGNNSQTCILAGTMHVGVPWQRLYESESYFQDWWVSALTTGEGNLELRWDFIWKQRCPGYWHKNCRWMTDDLLKIKNA